MGLQKLEVVRAENGYVITVISLKKNIEDGRTYQMTNIKIASSSMELEKLFQEIIKEQ